jgi:hypothetical protein
MLFVSELSIHDFLTEGYLIYFVQCYFFLSDHERNSSYNKKKPTKKKEKRKKRKKERNKQKEKKQQLGNLF